MQEEYFGHKYVTTIVAIGNSYNSGSITNAKIKGEIVGRSDGGEEGSAYENAKLTLDNCYYLKSTNQTVGNTTKYLATSFENNDVDIENVISNLNNYINSHQELINVWNYWEKGEKGLPVHLKFEQQSAN